MNEEHDKKIKIVAVCGSVQPNNFTGKALAIAADEFRKFDDVTLEVFNPSELELPLPGQHVAAKSTDALEWLQKSVQASTGLLLSTPEYHGSYSSVIKLVIDNLGYPSGLAGKPVALLGVASGAIGAVKALEHLRSVCSHVGAIVLPGPVSVAMVNNAFDDDGACRDPKVEQRIRRGAASLVEYIYSHICPKIALEELARNG